MKLKNLSVKQYPYAFTENGYCYKNEEAYSNDWDAICYIPESAFEEGQYINRDSGYSHNDLLLLCDNNPQKCNRLFSRLDWAVPETYVESGNNFEEDETDKSKPGNEPVQ